MISKIENWPLRYIGDEWISGSHDCWGFVRRVWAECFGLDVPVIDVDAINPLTVRREFRSQAERENWEVCDWEEGCAVLMGKSQRPCHVGVWTWMDRGGVVHCVEGSGVIFTAPSALLSMGYHILGCYRRVENG
jgi:hypothetical protein